MLKTPIPLLFAALLLKGCASVPPAPAELDNSRTYSAGRDVVWGRILATSARNSMLVRQADRASGVIAAEREIAAPRGDTISNWADCGWSGVFGRPISQRVELNYVVRPASAGAVVTVNGRFRELRLNIPRQQAQWVTCTSTGVLERQLLDAFHYD